MSQSLVHTALSLSLPVQLRAVYALLRFVLYTQKAKVPYLAPPTHYSHQHHMTIDANTRQALELVR